MLNSLLFTLLAAGNLWVVQQDDVRYGKRGPYEIQVNDLPNPHTYIAYDQPGHRYFYLTPVDHVTSYVKDSRLEGLRSSLLLKTDRTLQEEIISAPFDLERAPYFYYEVIDVLPGKEKRVEAYLRNKAAALSNEYTMHAYKTLFGEGLPKYLVIVSGRSSAPLKQLRIMPDHMKDNLRSTKSGTATFTKAPSHRDGVK